MHNIPCAPSWNARPRFRGAGALRFTLSGTYIFTGTTAVTWQLPPINPAPRSRDDGVLWVHNEGSGAGILSISRGSTDTIFDGISYTLISLDPGEGCILAPTGTNYSVIARTGSPKIVVTAAVAAGSVSLPANCFINTIIIRNTTANAVTGGIKLGTTAGATDILATVAVGANAFIQLRGADLSLSIFSPTAGQSIFYDAVTGWNSASLNITFLYQSA